MTIAYLLAVRAVFNLILFIVTISGAIACFVSHRNGITRWLGITALFASFYIADVVFISVVDVILYPEVRYWNLVVWNVITVFLTISSLWLGVRILKDD